MTGGADAAVALTVLSAVLLGTVLTRAFKGRELGFPDLLLAAAGLYAGLVAVIVWGFLAWEAVR